MGIVTICREYVFTVAKFELYKKESGIIIVKFCLRFPHRGSQGFVGVIDSGTLHSSPV